MFRVAGPSVALNRNHPARVCDFLTPQRNLSTLGEIKIRKEPFWRTFLLYNERKLVFLSNVKYGNTLLLGWFDNLSLNTFLSRFIIMHGSTSSSFSSSSQSSNILKLFFHNKLFKTFYSVMDNCNFTANSIFRFWWYEKEKSSFSMALVVVDTINLK